MTKNTVESAEETFESAMKRLEEIVSRMESGALPLDESLTAFEEGMKLSRMLAKRLGEAERKVEKLIREDGEVGTEPFEDGE